MTINIRNMEEDDILDVMLLAREFSKEAPASHKWDKNKTLSFLQTTINSPHMEVFVCEKDGEIVGGLVAVISEMYMSYTKQATELAWFVSKDVRGSSVAIRLVKHFEEWAKQNKADYITMSDITGIGNLSEMYSRMGYTSAETSYIKEL